MSIIIIIIMYMYKHVFFSIIVPTMAWKKFEFHVPVSHIPCSKGQREVTIFKGMDQKTGQEIDISDVSCQLGKKIALI